jgi:hypothetical protein
LRYDDEWLALPYMAIDGEDALEGQP